MSAIFISILRLIIAKNVGNIDHWNWIRPNLIRPLTFHRKSFFLSFAVCVSLQFRHHPTQCRSFHFDFDVAVIVKMWFIWQNASKFLWWKMFTLTHRMMRIYNRQKSHRLERCMPNNLPANILVLLRFYDKNVVKFFFAVIRFSQIICDFFSCSLLPFATQHEREKKTWMKRKCESCGRKVK